MPSNQNRNTGPHKVKLDNWIQAAPFEELLNMEITQASDGKAILSMPFLYEFSQGAGIMHGGAIVALADTALAMAVKSLLPEGTHFGTIGLDVKFLRAMTHGNITATAEINSFVERDLKGVVLVKDSDRNEIMKATADFRVARKQTEGIAQHLEKVIASQTSKN
ncbi:PaaI family thioesterase [Neptuniibacter sp.]|uniref:PaaI family thioesterase n=1 Tax=Neptuniibacter sp. TaxID=1962643 RepID=UPI0026149C96|nr:PaaI family thioesterase [Neptuniibacter sp.]MCP4596784.1 PaaI family thioesterase [Neptuniibacter sp.]